MSSENPTQHAGRPFASMLLDGQAPWPLSPNHESLQSRPNLSNSRLGVSPIDPRLSGTEQTSKVASYPGRQPKLSTTDLSPNATDASGSFNRGSSLGSPAPISRHLPSQDVSDETFDDAYVSFIFYCNPAVPLETDTSELKKAFRSPPKSDGKNFNTYTLFELIRKLELKEIKTWAQLAIDLGVEPPAMDKGQSAQKVQQYAVRLKVILPCPNC